jgi:hypothetical protein
MKFNCWEILTAFLLLSLMFGYIFSGFDRLTTSRTPSNTFILNDTDVKSIRCFTKTIDDKYVDVTYTNVRLFKQDKDTFTWLILDNNGFSTNIGAISTRNCDNIQM